MQSTSAKAYDLSRYEETYQPSPKRQARPDLTVRTTRKVKRGVSPIRLFCCGALLLALICVAINNNIAMVEMGDQLAKTNQELALLRSKGDILRAQLEGAASTKVVEEYASTQLGMGKMERYQITYIQFPEVDKIEVAEPTGSDALLQSVTNAYTDLVEYIRQK